MFGEEEVDSSTFSKWNARIEPKMQFPMQNGKVITIEQNSKVSVQMILKSILINPKGIW